MKRLIKTMVLVAAGFMVVACNGNKFDSKKNICVISREDGSGTKSAFMEIIGLKGKSDVKDVVIASGTAAVLEEVKINPYAIAYDSLGYITEDVKKLSVDGVEPTTTKIKSGDYKISRPLNVVYKESNVKSSDLLTSYLGFLGTKEAEKIISEKGYVVPVEATNNYQINTALYGTIKISGSTSLQPLMIVLAAKYEALQTSVKIEVSGGGSGTGYANAENDVSNFGMISEEFKLEKAPDCVFSTVAKDGIAIIVNKINTYTNISKDQLKNIYNIEQDSATKISMWKDLDN